MKGWGSNSQLGRPGQPSEVAPSFVFLASKDASLYCMDLSYFPS
jgi:NAD(P)-dependent dehydrogenase (short-subunit alcohol dehydrogenase family)